MFKFKKSIYYDRPKPRYDTSMFYYRVVGRAAWISTGFGWAWSGHVRVNHIYVTALCW